MPYADVFVTVVEGATPLSEVKVWFDGRWQFTDSQGKAEFDGLPAPATYTVTATKTGYVDLKYPYEALEGTRYLTLNMEKAAPKYYTVTIEQAAGGITDPPAGSISLREGSTFTVVGIPQEGYTFGRWFVNGVLNDVGPSLSVSVSRNTIVRPVFDAPPVEVVIPPEEEVVTEPASLTVFVIDGARIQPIPNAKVVLDGQARYTNDQGEAVFAGLASATYTVTASAAGYESRTDSFFLSPNEDKRAEMTLATPATLNPWDALLNWFKGMWDVLFGIFDGIISRVSESVGGVIQGLLDTTTEAMSPGSPDPETLQRIIKTTENMRKYLEKEALKIQKHSMAIEEAPGAAAATLSGLMAALVSVEITATIADQIQPARRIGIPDAGRHIMGALGISSLTSQIQTMPAEIGTLTPLRYWYNSQFTPRIPDLPDLITMLVREVITPSQYNQYAGWHGESVEWADRRWEAHWRLPAVGYINDAYHRDLISKSERDKYLVWHDYKNDPRPGVSVSDLQIFAGIQKTLIPRVDIRRGWEFGVISDERLLKGYKDLGYEDDAPLMTTIQKAVALDAEINMLRREYLYWYEYQLMTEEELIDAFKDLETLRPRIWYWRSLARLRRARRAKEALPELPAEEEEEEETPI